MLGVALLVRVSCFCRNNPLTSWRRGHTLCLPHSAGHCRPWCYAAAAPRRSFDIGDSPAYVPLFVVTVCFKLTPPNIPWMFFCQQPSFLTQVLREEYHDKLANGEYKKDSNIPSRYIFGKHQHLIEPQDLAPFALGVPGLGNSVFGVGVVGGPCLILLLSFGS
jgi:hypothetical protein